MVRKYSGAKFSGVLIEDLAAGGPGEKTRKNAFFRVFFLRVFDVPKSVRILVKKMCTFKGKTKGVAKNTKVPDPF